MPMTSSTLLIHRRCFMSLFSSFAAGHTPYNYGMDCEEVIARYSSMVYAKPFQGREMESLLIVI